MLKGNSKPVEALTSESVVYRCGPDPYHGDGLAHRTLWAHVLDQARRDLHVNTDVNCKSKLTENRYIKSRAWAWFNSQRTGVGSFHWICEVLDLKPDHELRLARRLYGGQEA